jgi:hypothetical protein
MWKSSGMESTIKCELFLLEWNINFVSILHKQSLLSLLLLLYKEHNNSNTIWYKNNMF